MICCNSAAEHVPIDRKIHWHSNIAGQLLIERKMFYRKSGTSLIKRKRKICHRLATKQLATRKSIHTRKPSVKAAEGELG